MRNRVVPALQHSLEDVKVHFKKTSEKVIK